MRFAVIGGGITGLVAAFRLRTAHRDADITVYEAAGRTGGKLHTLNSGPPGGGIPAEPAVFGALDMGAEAFVSRRPEVPALLAELGLSDHLVTPSSVRPLIWSQGAAHSLPSSTLMGIPSSAESVRGLVDDAALATIGRETSIPLDWDKASDVSVATLVGSRFGTQVLERSVDPLLGGVYSGLSGTIGVRAALPTLASALDRGALSLTQAVVDALPLPIPGPVFGGVRGGYHVVVRALEDAAKARIRRGVCVTALHRTGRTWQVITTGAAAAEPFDAVVLAVPAPDLAPLLTSVAPDAASAASEIGVASSLVVALALPQGVELPQNSGILVATDAGLSAKAFTLSSRKWPHLASSERALVRVSFGRLGDSAVLDEADHDIVDVARSDLATVTGIDGPITGSFVQRWPQGLPQYAPGHLDIVAAIESGVSEFPGLAVAGAWSHGVGVPACIASATIAAHRAAEVAR